jgi:hypothetical protein
MDIQQRTTHLVFHPRECSWYTSPISGNPPSPL